MAASGAWRRTRSSQLCLVSSIAAHSSPRGSTPASTKASRGTCVSTLPNVSRPSALASRRAGSTVSTSTLPPWCTAAIAAAAAAVVVLPTPPEPQWITISLAASSCSIEPVDAVLPARHQNPSSSARWRGDLAGGAGAVAALEEVRHVEQRRAGGQLLAQAGEVRGAGAAQRDRELGAVEDRAHRRAERLAERAPRARLAHELLEHLLLAAAEQLRAARGSRRRRRGRRRSPSASRSASSRVSLTGISSGAATITTPVCAGSPSMSSIQPVWSRTMPTCTSSWIAWGAASWPAMWPVATASTTTRS